MKFYEKLIKEFGINQPIIIEDLKDWNHSNDTIRKQLSNLAKEGKIIRYTHGVYYIPSQMQLTQTVLSLEKVLEYKYAKNNEERFGLFSGEYFEYKLGLLPNKPNDYLIITNKEKTRKRTININGHDVTLKNPYMNINEENYKIIQILYYLKDAEIETVEKNITILRNYVEKNKFERRQLLICCSAFPKKTLNKIIDSSLIKSFTV